MNILPISLGGAYIFYISVSALDGAHNSVKSASSAPRVKLNQYTPTKRAQ